MYKVKYPLSTLAALASTIVVAFVLTPSAAAATVTTTTFSNNETEPFYGGNCGFPLTATLTGEVRMTTIEKDNGDVQLIFTFVKPSTLTVTNPANGKNLTSLQAWGEILQISDSSFDDHLNGITWNFLVPGSGGVLQWIGYLNFATGSLHGTFTQDTTAFCNYVAGA